MTRQAQPPSPLGVGLTVAATIAALVAVLLLRHPELIGWLVAVYAVLALLGALVVAGEARAEVRALREEAERSERDAAAEARVARFQRDVWKRKAELLERRLADAVALAEHAPAPVVPLPGAAYVPSLQIVPPQRDGEHDRLAMSREEWAAIERETREL